LIEIREKKQEIDVGCCAQPAFGGAAEQDNGAQVVCECRLCRGNEIS
jgi:hypothetical protein